MDFASLYVVFVLYMRGLCLPADRRWTVTYLCIYIFITTQQKDQKATYTVGKSTKRKALVTCNQ